MTESFPCKGDQGHAGHDIFVDQSDRVKFCLFIQYASEMHSFKVHGFCFMNNHVHLLIQPLTENLSLGMHCLAFRYAQYFNKKYKRNGYLYQGRFKAILVQSGNYLAKLVRYIHLNPIRANIVNNIENYQWSSFLAYREKAFFSWLHQNLVLDFFGNDRERLFHYTIVSKEEAKDELIEIRKSMRRGAYGDETFLEEFRDELKTIDHKESNNNIPSLEYVFGSLDDIIQMVSFQRGISLASLMSDTRSDQLVLTRAILAVLIKKMKTVSFHDLGKKINRDPSSLSRLAKKMELDPQICNIITDLTAKFLNQDQFIT